MEEAWYLGVFGNSEVPGSYNLYSASASCVTLAPCREQNFKRPVVAGACDQSIGKGAAGIPAGAKI